MKRLDVTRWMAVAAVTLAALTGLACREITINRLLAEPGRYSNEDVGLKGVSIRGGHPGHDHRASAQRRSPPADAPLPANPPDFVETNPMKLAAPSWSAPAPVADQHAIDSD